MVNRDELQNKARLVESHKQHLDELQKRMEQVETVINEHQITVEILNRLISMAEVGEARAHVSIGSGVTLNYSSGELEKNTALIDLGGGVFGERSWSDTIEIIQTRQKEFHDLHETLLKQAGSIEENLGKLANEFNNAAKLFQQQNERPTANTTVDKEKSPEDEVEKPKSRRRSNLFGNELTLDD
ncbi:hypothetical protein N9U53_00885 [Euryarchaeota archaeon]|nr:hypothetical protein [Euryarchaeota archaeon]